MVVSGNLLLSSAFYIIINIKLNLKVHGNTPHQQHFAFYFFVFVGLPFII